MRDEFKPPSEEVTSIIHETILTRRFVLIVQLGLVGVGLSTCEKICFPQRWNRLSQIIMRMKCAKCDTVIPSQPKRFISSAALSNNASHLVKLK